MTSWGRDATLDKKDDGSQWIHMSPQSQNLCMLCAADKLGNLLLLFCWSVLPF